MRILRSALKLRPRLNVALNVARRDRERLARYRLCELVEIMNRLERIKSRLNDGRARSQPLVALAHLGHLTVHSACSMRLESHHLERRWEHLRVPRRPAPAVLHTDTVVYDEQFRTLF